MLRLAGGASFAALDRRIELRGVAQLGDGPAHLRAAAIDRQAADGERMAPFQPIEDQLQALAVLRVRRGQRFLTDLRRAFSPAVLQPIRIGLLLQLEPALAQSPLYVELNGQGVALETIRLQRAARLRQAFAEPGRRIA
ncbi:MAG: hypothetical protein AAF899_09705 [Pseudomonadota bacterium]